MVKTYLIKGNELEPYLPNKYMEVILKKDLFKCAIKYKTLVIDPPWNIKKIKRDVRPNQINMDYKTMSLQQIQELPISNIANENSVLFLWTIQKYLPKSFELLNKWGFKYLLTMTWNKNNGLCLFGFHWKTEFVIVGYKGKINMYPKGKTIPTLFDGKSKRHSEKPDEFYSLIRNSFPEPRIDIFARKTRVGFDIWGNEAPNFTQLSLPSADGDIINVSQNNQYPLTKLELVKS